MSAEQVIVGVIQRVYGDATQTVLDHRAATDIIAALRRLGWASLDEVGAIILAAGGEVTVPDSLRVRLGDVVVERFDDYAKRGTTFRAHP